MVCAGRNGRCTRVSLSPASGSQPRGRGKVAKGQADKAWTDSEGGGGECTVGGCRRARWATMGLKEVWLWASSGSKIHGGFTVGRDVDLWTCGVGTDGRPSVSPVHSKTTWNTAKAPARSWGKVVGREKGGEAAPACHDRGASKKAG